MPRRPNGQFGSAPALVRFVEKLKFEDGPLPTQCWVWQGARKGGRSGQEYGNFRPNPRRIQPNPVLVHVWAYETFRGPLLGLTVDHLCRNSLCANPRHMEGVTLQENLARKPAHSSRVSGFGAVVVLSPPELEEFEERAAILQYMAGFTKREAEFIAYEEIREGRKECG